jgi:hypothetical protein
MKLFLLLCWAVASAGSLIKKADTTIGVESRVDPSKWGVLDLISEMNTDLVRMNAKINGVRSFLQLSTADSPATTKGKPLKPVVKKADEKPKFDPTEAVKQMDKMGPAQMPAMLGLLKGMYASWKEKIGTANRREKDEKKDFDEEIKNLEAKKKRFKDDVNATKTYDGIEKYWKRQRDIAHRQYHTVLKLAHGGMEKFKTVMHAMQSAVDGKKPDAKTLAKVQSMEMPEVVLLQQVESLSRWSRGALSLLRDAKNPYPGMLAK